MILPIFSFFFFNDTATTEIYTLSLHDALPISTEQEVEATIRATSLPVKMQIFGQAQKASEAFGDRKSTRLNSSHLVISYAVFCLKKKKKHNTTAASTSRHRHGGDSRIKAHTRD